MTCQHCGGSGELHMTMRERNRYLDTRVNCSHCAGTGRIVVPGLNDHVAGEPLKCAAVLVSQAQSIELDSKKCVSCGATFERRPNEHAAGYRSRKTCSIRCMGDAISATRRNRSVPAIRSRE